MAPVLFCFNNAVCRERGLSSPAVRSEMMVASAMYSKILFLLGTGAPMAVRAGTGGGTAGTVQEQLDRLIFMCVPCHIDFIASVSIRRIVTAD